MKTVIALLFCLSASAFAAELECTVQNSFQDVYRQKIQIEQGEHKRIFEYNGFVFHLRSLDDSNYELEVFDPNVPARSYASGKIENSGDTLRWSLWTRYVSLDMLCK